MQRKPTRSANGSSHQQRDARLCQPNGNTTRDIMDGGGWFQWMVNGLFEPATSDRATIINGARGVMDTRRVSMFRDGN